MKIVTSKIKKTEELYSIKSRILLESFSIYLYPFFCHPYDKGFHNSVISPIITKN